MRLKMQVFIPISFCNAVVPEIDLKVYLGCLHNLVRTPNYSVLYNFVSGNMFVNPMGNSTYSTGGMLMQTSLQGKGCDGVCMGSTDADLAALNNRSVMADQITRAARSASADAIRTLIYPCPWMEVHIDIPPVGHAYIPTRLTNILPATKLQSGMLQFGVAVEVPPAFRHTPYQVGDDLAMPFLTHLCICYGRPNGENSIIGQDSVQHTKMEEYFL